MTGWTTSQASKRFVVSFSLAGLLLARVWQDVDQATSPMAVYRLGPGAPRTTEAVALIGLGIFTVLFALLIRVAEHRHTAPSPSTAARLLAAVAATAVGNLLLLAVEQASEYALGSAWLQGHDAAWLALLWTSRIVRWVVIPGTLAVAALWLPRWTWGAIQTVALIMTPFAAFRAAHAGYHLVRPRAKVLLVTPPNRASSGLALPLVLWLVFDEMDQSSAFEDPQNAPLLPNLQAFRRLAFHAERAWQPSDTTAKSIPAYLTGRLAVKERWVRGAGLQLRFAGSNRDLSWWQERTILHEAVALGHALAVLGHFHPYCQLFGQLTVACADFPACAAADLKAWLATPEGASLRATAQLELLRLLPLPATKKRFDGRVFRYSEWLLSNHGMETQSRCLGEVTARLRRWLRDSVASFYFVHLPVPHPPSVASSAELACRHAVPPGYAGNLHWADHFFEALRNELIRQDRWDTATVIITSDHTVRTDWRNLPELTPSLERAIKLRREPTVPLLIKLPHQREGLTYRRPFNAVLLHDIVQGILRGNIRRAEQIAAYIEDNHARAPLVAATVSPPPARLDPLNNP